MKRRAWQPAEIEHVRSHYTALSAQEIADALQRSVSSVYQAAWAMGLRKSKAFIADRARLRMAEPTHPARVSQFKRGLVPHNKGVKYPKGWAPGQMATTQFKKGCTPHTWRPIGSERITEEGYLQRKITDTGCTRRDWVNVHWLLWQDAHGPIPRGQVLAFKNRDAADIRLDNLELITRAALMRRNSIHTVLEPDVRKVVQLRGALNRMINHRSKKHEKQDAGRA